MKRDRTGRERGINPARPGLNGRKSCEDGYSPTGKAADHIRRAAQCHTNNCGAALILTLAIITLVIAVTLEINRQVRASVEQSLAYGNREHLHQIAASGLQAAMAMLANDRRVSDSDSLLEDWANADKVAVLLDDMPFDRGTVSVTITDELSRIQVNALVRYPERRRFNESQRAIWERLIKYAADLDENLEAVEPDAIINTAKDWLDAGDDEAITGISGAESDYYLNLVPPYACKNGPFSHIGELALLKAFPPRLLFGIDRAPGISRYLTVGGSVVRGDGVVDYPGRININTVPLAVIEAMLPWEHRDQAAAIVDYRQVLIETDNREAFQSPLWVRQAPGCGDLVLDAEVLTVASDLFRIESKAVRNGAELVVIARVRREKDRKTGKWICKSLQWEAV